MSIVELLDITTVNSVTEVTADMTVVCPVLIDLMVQEHRKFLKQGYYFPKDHPMRLEIERYVEEEEFDRADVYFDSAEFEAAMDDYKDRLEHGRVFETVTCKLMSLIRNHFKGPLTIRIMEGEQR